MLSRLIFNTLFYQDVQNLIIVLIIYPLALYLNGANHSCMQRGKKKWPIPKEEKNKKEPYNIFPYIEIFSDFKIHTVKSFPDEEW
jgi:hypothetical protein